ncbi:MAG TPA: alcohol dehydrogenase catalytic domain-containing protein, partial [Acidobacteriota bacterium]|nr:alcohol dehydrogenase catalytic domain-containing protein [Acidobacteriota bacterium]
MRAAFVERYGPPEVITIRDLPDPQPRANELLIRVRATTVSSGDARIRALRMPSPAFHLLALAALGVRGPRRAVLGSDFAGDIIAVGPAVRSFRVGDAVVGS